MLNVEDIKTALQNQEDKDGNSIWPLTTAEKNEAIYRMQKAGLVHEQRFALVLLDLEDALGKDFNTRTQYRYTFLKHDFIGSGNTDDLKKAWHFKNQEVPLRLRKYMVDVPKLNAKLEESEVRTAMVSHWETIGLARDEISSVVKRLKVAGLIKESDKKFYIRLNDENNYSFVNLYKDDHGKMKINTARETPTLQTIFTQEEIDRTPILKALESHKVEIKEVQND